MAKRTHLKSKLNAPVLVLLSGLILLGLAYVLFSLALGSGSNWHWLFTFVATFLAAKQIARAFRLIAHRS